MAGEKFPRNNHDLTLIRRLEKIAVENIRENKQTLQNLQDNLTKFSDLMEEWKNLPSSSQDEIPESPEKNSDNSQGNPVKPGI